MLLFRSSTKLLMFAPVQRIDLIDKSVLGVTVLRERCDAPVF